MVLFEHVMCHVISQLIAGPRFKLNEALDVKKQYVKLKTRAVITTALTQ